MPLSTLEQSFHQVIDELKMINGRLYVLTNLLQHSHGRLANINTLDGGLMFAGLPFIDVSQMNNNLNQLAMTNVYELNQANLSNEILLIISREGLFQISQSYEAVETFIYDHVAELILAKGNLHLFIDRRTNTTTFQSVRKTLKTFGDRKNNRHLLSILRANCELFKFYESANIYPNFDFENFYEFLSELRHCTTHNRMVATDELKRQSQFSSWVSLTTYVSSEIVLITSDQCRDLISRLTDFVFLIYKAVVKECYQIDITVDGVEEWLNNIDHGTN